jgi:hypothetical protein
MVDPVLNGTEAFHGDEFQLRKLVMQMETGTHSYDDLVRFNIPWPSDAFRILDERREAIRQGTTMGHSRKQGTPFACLMSFVESLPVVLGSNRYPESPPAIICALTGCVIPRGVARVIAILFALLSLRVDNIGAEFDAVAADILDFVKNHGVPVCLDDNHSDIFVVGIAEEDRIIWQNHLTADCIEQFPVAYDAVRAIVDCMTPHYDANNRRVPSDAAWSCLLVRAIAQHAAELVRTEWRTHHGNSRADQQTTDIMAELWRSHTIWAGWLPLSLITNETAITLPYMLKKYELRPPTTQRMVTPSCPTALISPPTQEPHDATKDIPLDVEAMLLYSMCPLRASAQGIEADESEFPLVLKTEYVTVRHFPTETNIPQLVVTFAKSRRCVQNVSGCHNHQSMAETVVKYSGQEWTWETQLWCGARHVGTRPVHGRERLHEVSARFLMRHFQRNVKLRMARAKNKLAAAQLAATTAQRTPTTLVAPALDRYMLQRLRNDITDCAAMITSIETLGLSLQSRAVTTTAKKRPAPS